MHISKIKEVSSAGRACLSILDAGLDAVLPSTCLPQIMQVTKDVLKIGSKKFMLHDFERIIVVGFGKASAEMAVIIEKILGHHIDKGIIIDSQHSKKKYKLKHIKIIKGQHPQPTIQNVKSTKQILNLTSDLTEKDIVICLISGGGSSLFTNPKMNFKHYQSLNSALLKSGATIQEVNTVRKHVDSVKGGQFAVHCSPAKVVSLMISDVPGNNPAFIASGPTVLDKTTVKDAKKIIRKYKLPYAKLFETPKDSKIFRKVTNLIIINPQKAVDAMKVKAKKLGLKPIVLSTRFTGEAKLAGKRLLKKLGGKTRTAVIAAGETTVTVTGNGKGGRNQELVLSVIEQLAELKNVALASMGTDGTDNTDIAGAVADGNTLKQATKKKLNPKVYLKNNDSYTFWRKLGKRIKTGPTGTNVADIMVAVRK